MLSFFQSIPPLAGGVLITLLGILGATVLGIAILALRYWSEVRWSQRCKKRAVDNKEPDDPTKWTVSGQPPVVVGGVCLWDLRRLRVARANAQSDDPCGHSASADSRLDFEARHKDDTQDPLD